VKSLQAVFKSHETMLETPVTVHLERILRITSDGASDDTQPPPPPPPPPAATAATAPPQEQQQQVSQPPECIVCLTPGATTDAAMLAHGSHGICVDGCLATYIHSEYPRRAIVNNDGCIQCPVDGCSVAINTNIHALAAVLDRATFQILLDAYVAATSTAAVTTGTDPRHHHMADLKFQAWATAVEAMLTPQCPWCQQAFYDFDGCYAIDCGKCERAFCGLCNTRLPEDPDPHDHVRRCFSNPQLGELFLDPSIFWKMHKQRVYKQLVRVFSEYGQRDMACARKVYERVRPLLN
jgi:hypothetical protein